MSSGKSKQGPPLRQLTEQELAEEDIYRSQLRWKWGKILKDLKDEGRI